jgi:hypothetical protein
LAQTIALGSRVIGGMRPSWMQLEKMAQNLGTKRHVLSQMSHQSAKNWDRMGIFHCITICISPFTSNVFLQRTRMIRNLLQLWLGG